MPYDDSTDTGAVEPGAEDSTPSGYPEITLPADIELEGDSGEAVVNWKRKPNGTICLTSFEGKPLGSPDSEQEYEGPSAHEQIDQMAKA